MYSYYDDKKECIIERTIFMEICATFIVYKEKIKNESFLKKIRNTPINKHVISKRLYVGIYCEKDYNSWDTDLFELLIFRFTNIDQKKSMPDDKYECGIFIEDRKIKVHSFLLQLFMKYQRIYKIYKIKEYLRLIKRKRPEKYVNENYEQCCIIKDFMLGISNKSL
jgi:hypothetical protein